MTIFVNFKQDFLLFMSFIMEKKFTKWEKKFTKWEKLFPQEQICLQSLTDGAECLDNSQDRPSVVSTL
jgi:hypothetical protein